MLRILPQVFRGYNNAKNHDSLIYFYDLKLKMLKVTVVFLQSLIYYY